MGKQSIASVETHALRVPRSRPVQSSYARYDALEVVSVQIRTEDGLEGLGYAKIIGTGSASIRSFLDTEYAPLVMGRDPLEVKALWGEMFLHAQSRGRKGVAMYAMSAVDIALWDLLAQRAGMPLHHVLGAVRDRVPVYGNGCWLSLSQDELLDEVRRYVDLGCFGVKIKIGAPDLRHDLRRLEAVREEIGDDVQLMVDANQRYDVLTAIRMSKLLEPLEVTWFEEPVSADSLHDQARVAAASPVPIAAGENEYSRHGFRDLIDHGGIHILQPDVHRVGGVTEFMRIGALADAWGLPVLPHTSYELQSQLVAALPNARGCEYYDWFPEGFFQESFEIVDGHVTVPQTPGIGSRFAPGVIEQYRVD